MWKNATKNTNWQCKVKLITTSHCKTVIGFKIKPFRRTSSILFLMALVRRYRIFKAIFLREYFIQLINLWMLSAFQSFAYTLESRYAENCSSGRILVALAVLSDFSIKWGFKGGGGNGLRKTSQYRLLAKYGQKMQSPPL